MHRRFGRSLRHISSSRIMIVMQNAHAHITERKKEREREKEDHIFVDWRFFESFQKFQRTVKDISRASVKLSFHGGLVKCFELFQVYDPRFEKSLECWAKNNADFHYCISLPRIIVYLKRNLYQHGRANFYIHRRANFQITNQSNRDRRYLCKYIDKKMTFLFLK